jgi:Rad3-related DNA helicase
VSVQAHNIDNVCIEALSVDLDERSLDKASRCLGRLSSEVGLSLFLPVGHISQIKGAR